MQTFPQEHSSHWITSLIHLNSNTIVSASDSLSSSLSDNVIVIWTKTKSKSSSLYGPLQRITKKETGGTINSLVLITQKKEEEVFGKKFLLVHFFWRHFELK